MNSSERSLSRKPKKMMGKPRMKLKPVYTHDSKREVPDTAV